MVKPKIVATQRPSELQQFAQWFHQDFFLMAPDLLTGTRMYLETLTADRKTMLADELGAFLVEHRSPKVIRNSWRRLGAGIAPRGLDVPATFRAMLDLMRQS
jgi:hypothetical protein